MSHELIDHNNDLRMLKDKGYNIELVEGYLVIRNIPYVNENTQIKYGTIASTLDLSGNNTVRPSTHVALWAGDHPCDSKGSPLLSLVIENKQKQIRDGLVFSFSFSQKPSEGYDDYYKKMTWYIQILQNHACAIESTVTAFGGAE